jgi:hypothetical protein
MHSHTQILVCKSYSKRCHYNFWRWKKGHPTQQYGAGVLKAKKEATVHSFGGDAAFLRNFNSSVLPRRKTLSSLPLKASHPSLLSVVHSQLQSVWERERGGGGESRRERRGAKGLPLFCVFLLFESLFLLWHHTGSISAIHTFIHTDARPPPLLFLSRASVADLLVRFFLWSL